jgi:hypothetical protein
VKVSSGHENVGLNGGQCYDGLRGVTVREQELRTLSHELVTVLNRVTGIVGKRLGNVREPALDGLA